MFSVFRCVFFLLFCLVVMLCVHQPDCRAVSFHSFLSLSLWLFFVMRLVVCNILCYSRLHFGSLLCKTCSHFGFGFNKTDFFVALPLHCLVKYFSFIIWMLVLCSCNHYVALLLFCVHRKTKKISRECLLDFSFDSLRTQARTHAPVHFLTCRSIRIVCI